MDLSFQTALHWILTVLTALLPWTLVIPPTDALNSYATAIVNTNGSYLVAGVTDERGDLDIFMLTLHADGTAERCIVMGGEGDDYVHKVVRVMDGGCLLVGYTRSFNSKLDDILIVKLNSEGCVEWGEVLEGAGVDRAMDAAECPDGGYIIVGYTDSFSRSGYDALIVRINSTGGLEWVKVFGDEHYDDCLYAVKPTERGYLVTGLTWSPPAGMSDILALEIDSRGVLLWCRIIGGGEYDEAYDGIPVEDGFILTGVSWSYWFGFDDAFILKLNKSGGLDWFKAVGGRGYDGARKILKQKDGYVLVGFTSSFGVEHYYDVIVVKLGRLLKPIWGKIVGGNKTDYAYSACLTEDGGCVVAGYSSSFNAAGSKEAMVFKLDAEGRLRWSYLIGLDEGVLTTVHPAILEEAHTKVEEPWDDWVADVEPEVKTKNFTFRDASLTFRKIKLSIATVKVNIRGARLNVRDVKVVRNLLESFQIWLYENAAFLLLLLPLIVAVLYLIVKFLIPLYAKAVKIILKTIHPRRLWSW